MDIMSKSNDGFYIAEQDMHLRGYGDINGLKQSGIENLFFTDFMEDKKTLESINKTVIKILKDINSLYDLMQKKIF